MRPATWLQRASVAASSQALGPARADPSGRAQLLRLSGLQLTEQAGDAKHEALLEGDLLGDLLDPGAAGVHPGRPAGADNQGIPAEWAASIRPLRSRAAATQAVFGVAVPKECVCGPGADRDHVGAEGDAPLHGPGADATPEDPDRDPRAGALASQGEHPDCRSGHADTALRTGHSCSTAATPSKVGKTCSASTRAHLLGAVRKLVHELGSP